LNSEFTSSQNDSNTFKILECLEEGVDMAKKLMEDNLMASEREKKIQKEINSLYFDKLQNLVTSARP
jgi:hypothetical protein